MRTNLVIAGLIGLFALTGCYKDEVDVAALDTNPWDPDYGGPAFIEVVDEQTVGPFPGGVFNQELTVEVDFSVLPVNSAITLRVVDQATGVAFDPVPQQSPGGSTFVFTDFNGTPGVEICYAIAVEVQFSTTRSETHCATP